MNEHEANLKTIDLSDRAAAVRGAVSAYIHDNINNLISNLVAHYRGGQLTHDMLVGKVGEMSALMSLLEQVHSDLRAGEAAREREYGDGSQAQQPTTPGTRSRPKSS